MPLVPPHSSWAASYAVGEGKPILPRSSTSYGEVESGSRGSGCGGLMQAGQAAGCDFALGGVMLLDLEFLSGQ